jgi:hypothetical protein
VCWIDCFILLVVIVRSFHIKEPSTTDQDGCKRTPGINGKWVIVEDGIREGGNIEEDPIFYRFKEGSYDKANERIGNNNLNGLARRENDDGPERHTAGS